MSLVSGPFLINKQFLGPATPRCQLWEIPTMAAVEVDPTTPDPATWLRGHVEAATHNLGVSQLLVLSVWVNPVGSAAIGRSYFLGEILLYQAQQGMPQETIEPLAYHFGSATVATTTKSSLAAHDFLRGSTHIAWG